MQRAFLTVDGRQLHCRVAGDGAPVVLLHPSPLSSSAVLPVATEIARHFRVYALDTPGYGLSDPPPRQPASLQDYLPTFAAALDALGLGRICLYGAATGAQFAVEFARRYPERCAHVVLDSAGHIDPAECDRIVPAYFPDVTPRADGGHLATYWQMVRDLFVFFPWPDARAARRIPRDLPPPAAMQSMLLDYLRAGEGYAWAYRPAFYNENAARAQGVTVPATLVRWEGSVVLRITDELIAAGLPPNFAVLHAGPAPERRTRGIAAWLRERYQGPPAPPLPAQSLPQGRFASRYLALRGAQLHLRQRGGDGLPRVAIAAPTGAARLVEPRLAAGSGPALVLEPPGSGESDPLPPADGPATLEGHAAVLGEALDELGLGECELEGHDGGAGIAIELALQRPRQVRRLRLAGEPLPDAATRAALLEHEPRDFPPRGDGAHLLEAWHLLRDRRLWTRAGRGLRAGILPGDPALDPRELQRELVELMCLGPRYRAARAAELTHAHETRLTRLACPVVLDDSPGRAAGLASAAGESPGAGHPAPRA
ncbi:MAG: alpha/beta fold hydrolase [Steroidobacteraceae bacterium]|nr:alpha/beta fold hydrolase [Steroidobacteraceae bacterium]